MTDSVEVADLLQARGFEWAIRLFSPSSEAGSHYSGKLTALKEFMATRGMGESAPSLADLHVFGDVQSIQARCILGSTRVAKIFRNDRCGMEDGMCQ